MGYGYGYGYGGHYGGGGSYSGSYGGGGSYSGSYGGSYAGDYANLSQQQIQNLLNMPPDQFNQLVSGGGLAGYGSGATNMGGGSGLNTNLGGMNAGSILGQPGGVTNMGGGGGLNINGPAMITNPDGSMGTGIGGYTTTGGQTLPGGYGSILGGLTGGGGPFSPGNILGGGTGVGSGVGSGGAAGTGGQTTQPTTGQTTQPTTGQTTQPTTKQNSGNPLLNAGLAMTPGLMALAYASQQNPFDTSALTSALTGSQGFNTNTLNGLAGSSVDSSSLKNMLGQTTNTSGLQSALSLAQRGADTSQLQSIYNQQGANAPGFVKAAIDPLQRNISAGYGAILQNDAQRGIAGSSFANNDIGNYISNTGYALSNAGANAYETALGAQGATAGNILNAQQANIGLQGSLGGQISNASAGDLSRNANIAQGITGASAQSLSDQISAAGTAGSLQNSNLALQGNLASQLAQFNALNQQNKNNLYGRGFTLLGQGLQGSNGQGGNDTLSQITALLGNGSGGP